MKLRMLALDSKQFSDRVARRRAGRDLSQRTSAGAVSHLHQGLPTSGFCKARGTTFVRNVAISNARRRVQDNEGFSRHSFAECSAQICRRKGSFAWTSPNMSAGGDSLKT